MNDNATAVSATASPFLPFAPPARQTLHRGLDEMPYADFGNGIELALLHVDLRSGLWVNRTRLQPGTVVPTHYHPGPVFAVTLQGSWWYSESPEQRNTVGSYLFEPAGSRHTLTVPANQTQATVAWFAIYGPNLNLDAHGAIESVLDAGTMLGLYRWLCAAQGLDSNGVIVMS